MKNIVDANKIIYIRDAQTFFWESRKWFSKIWKSRTLSSLPTHDNTLTQSLGVMTFLFKLFIYEAAQWAHPISKANLHLPISKPKKPCVRKSSICYQLTKQVCSLLVECWVKLPGCTYKNYFHMKFGVVFTQAEMQTRQNSDGSSLESNFTKIYR